MELHNLSKIKGKKGAGGMGIAIKVFGALMVLGVLAFVFVIIFGSLDDAAESSIPLGRSIVVVNETLTSVEDGTGEYLAPYTNLGVVCTIDIVSNLTHGITMAAGNYTQTNCHIVGATGIGADLDGFNNSDWYVTYSYQFKDNAIRDIPRNLTAGASSFFSNTGTWLTLLSVVIIISIVSLVLVRVRGGRATGGGGMTGGSRSNEGLI